MRATPPSRRMSAGTRSSAITAAGPGVLGDLRLLGVDDVHDDAALEHLGQAGLDAERGLVSKHTTSLLRPYFSRNALIRSAYCAASRLYTPYARAWIIESSAVCERTNAGEFDE